MLHGTFDSTNQSSTTQIWVVMRHQYRISVLVPQTSFGGETSGRVTKCWLFPQAKQLPTVALSQIDYEHTRHCGDCLCQQTNYAKGILENLSRGMRMAEWKMSPPCFCLTEAGEAGVRQMQTAHLQTGR